MSNMQFKYEFFNGLTYGLIDIVQCNDDHKKLKIKEV